MPGISRGWSRCGGERVGQRTGWQGVISLRQRVVNPRSVWGVADGAYLWVPRCGGRLRLIALIEEAAVIERSSDIWAHRRRPWRPTSSRSICG